VQITKYTRREKRRLAVSLMLVLVSVLIFASVTLISFQDRPTFWGYYMLSLFILLLGIIFLAFLDSVESLRYFFINLGATRKQVNEQIDLLEKELQKIHISQGSNNGKGN